VRTERQKGNEMKVRACGFHFIFVALHCTACTRLI